MENSFYKHIIHEAPFGFAHHEIILDDAGKPCDYRFIEVNEAFEKLSGLKKEDIIGRTVRQSIPGIEHDQFDWIGFYGEIALSCGQREFEQYSEPLRRWYKVHVFSEKTMFFTTTFIDVTDIKKQHEEMEGFFSVNLDFFCIADLDGYFIKTNEAWSQFLGYSSEMLIGMKFLEFVHPDDLPATLSIMNTLAKGEDVLCFSNRYLAADRTYRNIEWRASPKGKVIYASARDITEKVRLHESLLESEIKYRSLVEQMQDGLLVDDMHGCITYVNRRFCELVEYDEHELIGRNGYDFLLTEKGRKIVAEKDKNRITGRSEQYELMLLKKSGQTIELLLDASPVKNEAGQIVGSISMCKDITELKKVERELQSTKEAMQISMQLAKVGRWAKDFVKNDDYWCDITREIHDVSSDFIPGMQNAIDFYKEGESRNMIVEVVNKAINNGLPYDIEVQLVTAKGNVRWVRTIGKPEFNEDGNCIRLYGAIQDITEQKLQTEKLAANERFQTQLNNCVYQILGTQNSEELLDTLSQNICALFNADGAYITLWDENLKTVIPVASSAISNDKYKAKHSHRNELTMTESVLKAGKPLTAEDVLNSPYLSPQIAERYPARSLLGLPLISAKVKLGAILIGFNTHHKFTRDEILYGEIVARDISLILHKMQIMEELKLSESRLQTLNAQKDKFFSIIAHDLKSPFNTILGFSEILVDQVKEKDFEGIDKYAAIIQQSSNRAFDLLMNLLEWSRAQIGKMDFNPEYFEMVSLIEETCSLLDDNALQKSITIQKQLPHNLPVFADLYMISTVLRNLISNAIKFTNAGGEIIVSAGEAATEIVVSVKDNGVGISKDRIGKIFSIGESESTPGTAKEKGTGLGLILCKEFIENHGGRVWVESTEGQGSEFYFAIPSNQNSLK
jgi:PAS domain S-box-containing protein